MKTEQKCLVGPDVLWEDVDDEVVVVHCTQGQAWVLNMTAARIWRILVSGCSLSEAARRLARDFKLPSAKVKHAVLAFWGELSRLGLVCPVTHPAAVGDADWVLAASELSPSPRIKKYPADPRSPIVLGGGTGPT